MKKLLDMIFPPRCVVCDEILKENEQGVHNKCRDKLFYVTGTTCMHCGRPVFGRDEYCLDCGRKSKAGKLVFKQGKALFSYKGDVKKSMYRFKYSNKREYAPFFAEESLRSFGEWIRNNKIDAIVPVPMYKWKQRRRGYNQAEAFAKELSRISGIPVVNNLVVRSRNTKPMKELNDIQRKNNLENAFQIKTNIVQYYYILVVDDIYTTGNTADAVSEILLLSGVKEVFFLSICIAGE